VKEKKRMKRSVLLLFLWVVFGVALITSEAMAQTQGDVAMQLAAILGLDVSSQANAITALTFAGVVPAGGWNATAEATQSFVSALYVAVNSAVSAGTITPPANLGNASALTAAASTAAGISSTTAVNGVVSGGGNQGQANTGSSYGSALAGGPGPGGGPGGAPGGGAGGSGGGGTGGGGGGGINVGSKSR